MKENETSTSKAGSVLVYTFQKRKESWKRDKWMSKVVYKSENISAWSERGYECPV